VLATVVATSGSTYRRAGARMLLTEGGWAAGSISGGCLEGDVVGSAWERTVNGPALVTYDSTSDQDIVWGFGLGCNGVVQVLMERLPAGGGFLAFLAKCSADRTPVRSATVVSEGDRLGERWTDDLPFAWAEVFGDDRAEGARIREWNGLTLLLEAVLPPRPLVIYGAGHDAVPLVAAAKAVGWHVTVVDGRAAYAVRERFPEADRVLVAPPYEDPAKLGIDSRTAVVVMTHHYLNDLDVLRKVLPSPAEYIGLLGPRVRTERLLGEMKDAPPTPYQLARLHAPIGLDLGAEGPDEIALSIVAEIQAFFARRPAGHLNGRIAPLHPEAHETLARGTVESPACARN